MNSKKSKTSKTNGGKSARIRGGRQILVVGLVALVLAAGYYRWTLGNLEESAVSVSSTAVPENGSASDGNSAVSPSPTSADAETRKAKIKKKITETKINRKTAKTIIMKAAIAAVRTL